VVVPSNYVSKEFEQERKKKSTIAQTTVYAAVFVLQYFVLV
jgi:hypothetical protein